MSYLEEDESPFCRRVKSNRLRNAYLDSSGSSYGNSTPSSQRVSTLLPTESRCSSSSSGLSANIPSPEEDHFYSAPEPDDSFDGSEKTSDNYFHVKEERLSPECSELMQSRQQSSRIVKREISPERVSRLDDRFVNKTPRSGGRSRSMSRTRCCTVKREVVEGEFDDTDTVVEDLPHSKPISLSRRRHFSSDLESEEEIAPEIPTRTFIGKNSGGSSSRTRPTPIVTASSRCSSSDSDSTFDKYLKTLKPNGDSDKGECSDVNDDELRRSGCSRRRRTGSFVVPDEEVSSGSESSSHGDSDVENVIPRKQLSVKNLSSVNGSLAEEWKHEFASPSVKKKSIDSAEHFVMSLSVEFPKPRHKDAAIFVEKGIKHRDVCEDLVKRLFKIVNSACFKDKLPSDLTVVWNSRLRKTAGICRHERVKNPDGILRKSSIQLSPKVCTTADRVRDTLIHEMCHAAVWIVDGLIKEGHGPAWKAWAGRCMRRFPQLPFIERCHNYDIEAKYVYTCSGRGCGQQVHRHSNSLDITRKVCGICRGRFEVQVRTRGVLRRLSLSNKAHTGKNTFAAFVKTHYGKYRTPGTEHRKVMQLLSAKWREQKKVAKEEQTEQMDEREDLAEDVLQAVNQEEAVLEAGEDISWEEEKENDSPMNENTMMPPDLDISTLSIS